MKNILFVGPYRQADGWGEASRCYINAIASQPDTNLTTYPIYYTDNICDIPKQILQYEQNKSDSYDYIIQKALPGNFFYNGRYSKNIGITELETSDWTQCYNSIQNMNSMDEIWVPSNLEKQNLLKAGVTKNIKVISQSLDVDLIKSVKDKLPLPQLIENTFKFYFIGEHIYRKNLQDLIVAFSLAFDFTDDVTLIIKSSLPGVSDPNIARQNIESEISEIKKKMSTKGRFKKELVITNRLSYEDMIKLHNACDCFIMPSYGEAFCRPAAEALVLGKTPIVNKNTGMSDFINDSNGFLIKSGKVPVLLNHKPLSDEYDFYNSNQSWYKIDVYDLVEKLRYVYKNRDSEDLKTKSQNGQSSIDNFSYQSIGSKLCI